MALIVAPFPGATHTARALERPWYEPQLDGERSASGGGGGGGVGINPHGEFGGGGGGGGGKGGGSGGGGRRRGIVALQSDGQGWRDECSRRDTVMREPCRR